MAVFGRLPSISLIELNINNIETALEYLRDSMNSLSVVRKRIMSLEKGSFERIELDHGMFALEQVYYSNSRANCFFESHKKYIDIQLIVSGAEYIDVKEVSELDVDIPYNADKDIIKYKDNGEGSVLMLSKGDLAVFFSSDAHMPCLRIDSPQLVYKTVVKVPAQ